MLEPLENKVLKKKKHKSQSHQIYNFKSRFNYICSIEYSVTNRLPIIWNSPFFKTVILKELGIFDKTQELFFRWFDSENFKGNFWVRYLRKTNEFVLKNKSEFAQEINDFKTCEIPEIVETVNSDFYEKDNFCEEIKNVLDAKKIKFSEFKEIEWSVTDILARKKVKNQNMYSYKVVWANVNGKIFVG